MNRKLHDKILTAVVIAIAIAMFSGVAYFIYKSEKKYEAIRKADNELGRKIRNAQCRVLRENNIDLIGVTCSPIEGDIWEVKTLTGRFIQVHKSRITPNGENNLIIPYKKEAK